MEPAVGVKQREESLFITMIRIFNRSSYNAAYLSCDFDLYFAVCTPMMESNCGHQVIRMPLIRSMIKKAEEGNVYSISVQDMISLF